MKNKAKRFIEATDKVKRKNRHLRKKRVEAIADIVKAGMIESFAESVDRQILEAMRVK